MATREEEKAYLLRAVPQVGHSRSVNGVAWSLQVRRRGTRQVIAEGLADGGDASVFETNEALPLQAGEAMRRKDANRIVGFSMGPALESSRVAERVLAAKNS